MNRSFASQCLSVLFALAVTSVGARAQTYFQYVSQPGDFAGGGNSQTITSAQATFNVDVNGFNGIEVSIVNNGSALWFLDFSTQFSTPLTVGTYLDATRYPFNSGFAPGLSVWSAVQCQTLFGKFVVSEVVVDASHHVQSFAADFEQHCDGNTPAMFGAIRFNSSKPPLITRLVNSAAQASFAFSSELGDPVGNGAAGFFHYPPDLIQSTVTPDGVLIVTVTGAGHANYDWEMIFDPGDGSLPAVGVYSGCTKYPSNPFPAPGIFVSSPSGGGDPCASATGLFRVGAFQLDAHHQVVKLELDFNYHCNGGASAFFGSLRVGSNSPPTGDEFLSGSFAQPYCFGATCPCGNDDALGGCRNSSGGGATLTVGDGSASIAANDLVLATYGLPLGQPALLLASAPVTNVPFGAGVLCVGGSAVRLAIDAHPSNGDAHFANVAQKLGLSKLSSSFVAGTVLRFQTWYRDPHAACSATTNLSNALQVRFDP